MAVDDLRQPSGLSDDLRTEVEEFERAARTLDAGFSVSAVGFSSVSPAAGLATPDTASEQFREWFGTSKLVHPDGKPMTLYHGTAGDFSKFELSSAGSFGAGVYLTPDPSVADLYSVSDGQNVMPVFARMERPYHYSVPYDDELSAYGLLYEVLDKEIADEIIAEDTFDMDERLSEALQDLGHDGLIATYSDGAQEYLVFSAGQVKSALTNTGDFDPFCDDIMFQRAPTAAARHDVVRSNDGTPRMCFHGTAKTFSRFALSDGWYGRGIYFTDCPNAASQYAEDAAEMGGNARVVPVFLRMDNPYRFTEVLNGEASNVQLLRALGVLDSDVEKLIQSTADMARTITAMLKAKGHDGLIVQQVCDKPELIVFSNKQVEYAFEYRPISSKLNGIIEPPNAAGVAFVDSFGVGKDDRDHPPSDIASTGSQGAHARADNGIDQSDELAAVESLAAFFGSRVAVYSRAGGLPRMFNGAKHGHRIWIDVDADKPLHSVFAHELLHLMKEDRPELYEALHGVLKPLLVGREQYGRLLGLGGRSRAYIEEEMIAEVFADRFCEESFWKLVAARRPAMLAQIGTFVTSVLTKVKAFVQSMTAPGCARFISDVDVARRAIADAVAEYATGAMPIQPDGLLEALARERGAQPGIRTMSSQELSAAFTAMATEPDETIRDAFARHTDTRPTYDAIHEWVTVAALQDRSHEAHQELVALAIERGLIPARALRAGTGAFVKSVESSAGPRAVGDVGMLNEV